MAKKKKNSYSDLLKRAKNRAIFTSNPAAAKVRKAKKLNSIASGMENKMTNPERIFAKMMKELEVDFEAQKVVGKKIFDFYIPSKNMIVEVHGDYWHSNPLIYEGKQLNKIQLRNKKNDEYKERVAKGNNYSFFVVWEYDLKNNYKKQKSRFKKIIKDE